MRSLICGLLALMTVDTKPAQADQRCERMAEVKSIVQAVAAPSQADEAADLPLELQGALAGWLGEEWRA